MTRGRCGLLLLSSLGTFILTPCRLVRRTGTIVEKRSLCRAPHKRRFWTIVPTDTDTKSNVAGHETQSNRDTLDKCRAFFDHFS